MNLTLAIWVFMPVLAVAIVMAFIRLMRGPTLPDRVVALDLLSTEGIGVIVVYAMATGEEVILDVAILLALVSFLGTVAFARYLEKRV